MNFSLNQIAEMLGGVVEGDGDSKVSSIGKIENASPNELCFLANDKYESFIYTTKAGAVLVSNSFAPKKEIKTSIIRVEDPYLAFTQLLEYYQKFLLDSKKGVEMPSYIGEQTEVGDNIYRGAFSYIGNNCKIGSNVKIYPNVVISENVVIGDNTILFPGVKVYSGCKIGSNCKIQAGAVVGSDGFGFAPRDDGSYKTIPQLGNVIVEDNVDIGANATIDCSTLGSTIIHEGAKIDNLVQIAHNVEIGKHTGIAALSGVSGSAKVGDYCIIAGQVGIVGHISIADKTTIGAQSGISKTIKDEGKFIQGSPAFDYKENLKALAVFRKLPELEKQIRELSEKILNLHQT